MIPVGLEPTTFRLKVGSSIQIELRDRLSFYGNDPIFNRNRYLAFIFQLCFHFFNLILARHRGIEPRHRGFGDLTDTLSV